MFSIMRTVLFVLRLRTSKVKEKRLIHKFAESIYAVDNRACVWRMSRTLSKMQNLEEVCGRV